MFWKKGFILDVVSWMKIEWGKAAKTFGRDLSLKKESFSFREAQQLPIFDCDASFQQSG